MADQHINSVYSYKNTKGEQFVSADLNIHSLNFL